MVDVTKIRQGARILVEAEFRYADKDQTCIRLKGHAPSHMVNHDQVKDVRFQPFLKGDPVHHYFDDQREGYSTGTFEAGLRDRDECLILDTKGGLHVVPFNAVFHVNIKEPG